MFDIELSITARNDIEEILDYTFDIFGALIMDKYSSEIDENLLLIRQNL